MTVRSETEEGRSKMRYFKTRAAIILAAVAVPLAAAPGAGMADTVRIGISAALTGPAAFVGVSIRRGAEMATDAINAKGGIGGKKIELVIRDDEHNPVKTVANHRELVEREKVVAMLGTTNSAGKRSARPWRWLSAQLHAH
ncbi:MAG: ABC transporter substrate-binding protein, partial [Rhodospirillaceae bacterium]|nr:ABC transporter substrate-binding protein [Rhodospirillaceae bacterium]